MKTVGVICEYNPFHNGHRLQFERIRAEFGPDCGIVCLMSGCYVQRGEPALFAPAVRAEAAVRCGADLVLELPVTYALRSAEGFADGGVSVLSLLGVDVLCFGAESGDLAQCMTAAQRMLSPAFSTALKEALQTGISFAAAREAALTGLADPALLRRPNDILAVEYCKALLRQNAKMEAFCIRRTGDYHAVRCDPEQPSASAIRAAIADDLPWEYCVPSTIRELYRGAQKHTMAAGERAVLARLRALSEAEFSALPFGAEGLWRKLMHACRTEPSVEAILQAVKSKRYARTRLQRMLLCAFLGLQVTTLSASAPYVRILALNERGGALVRRFRAAQTLPLNHPGQTRPEAYQALEKLASDLYSLFQLQGPFSCAADHTRFLHAEDWEGTA